MPKLLQRFFQRGDFLFRVVLRRVGLLRRLVEQLDGRQFVRAQRLRADHVIVELQLPRFVFGWHSDHRRGFRRRHGPRRRCIDDRRRLRLFVHRGRLPRLTEDRKERRRNGLRSGVSRCALHRAVARQQLSLFERVGAGDAGRFAPRARCRGMGAQRGGNGAIEGNEGVGEHHPERPGGEQRDADETEGDEHHPGHLTHEGKQTVGDQRAGQPARLIAQMGKIPLRPGRQLQHADDDEKEQRRAQGGEGQTVMGEPGEQVDAQHDERERDAPRAVITEQPLHAQQNQARQPAGQAGGQQQDDAERDEPHAEELVADRLAGLFHDGRPGRRLAPRLRARLDETPAGWRGAHGSSDDGQ